MAKHKTDKRFSVTLDGIKFQYGDRYRENDSRFQRFVEVTGYDAVSKTVQLNGKTWAKAKRFNGQHHGYIKVGRRAAHKADCKTNVSCPEMWLY